MARLSLKNGEFERCVSYCDVAIKRLTSRNQHPTDTEAFYLRGLALIYLSRDKEAYDTLYRAAWNYNHRSAALFELACLDSKNGEYKEALLKLDESIGLNKGHTKAQNLKSAILRLIGDKNAKSLAYENARDDLLDLFAKIELSHYEDNSADIAQFRLKAENIIDVAIDYMRAGLYVDALYTLKLADESYPLVHFYRAYLENLLGQDSKASLDMANSLPTGYCFPSRLEDILVLSYATYQDNAGANANYYLGCLYYDKFRYSDAAACWQACVKTDPTHGKAWRNLALYYFDKVGDAASAREALENAMLHKNDPRLLLEYEQLLKNSNCSIEERLAVYEKYPELLAQRDDCYLDKLTMISQTGDFKRAIEMAAKKRFHIYEGGEGKLTKQHAWMHTLYGKELCERGLYDEAKKIFDNGVNMPKSYGEAKTFFNQEAHIFYYLAKLYEATDKLEEAKAAYEEAAIYKAAVSELSLFRALALIELGRREEAYEVLDEMLRVADNFIVNKDLRTYYGVGSPSPMPFEYNIEKNNLRDGHILRAFALLGYGKAEEAEASITVARKLDPNDFRIFAFDRIKK